jgi:Lrp/AsnC family transcriptional regulator
MSLKVCHRMASMKLQNDAANGLFLEKICTFRATAQTIPEIVEVYRMSGDVDDLLRVVVPDIADQDQVYKQLIQQVPLSDVSSSFAMEELKYTTAVPLNYAAG